LRLYDPATYITVSIHAPARGATSFEDILNLIPEVSIHAPARGATPDDEKLNKPVEFQSTHPQGVRLATLLLITLQIYVSIHAPARGATLTKSFNLRKPGVSIHAPARGATHSYVS
jgi:hypothetical protein